MISAVYPFQQEKIINPVRELMKQGQRRILVVSPTGSGKTVMASYMIASATEKKMRSNFVVHRRELVRQTTRTFGEVGIRHGVISAGFPLDVNQLAQVSSVQTLARRSSVPPSKFYLWDEAHHATAAQWAKLMAAQPNAYHVGFTATPERLDGSGLKEHFDVMVVGPSVAWLIEQGYLSPYKMFAPAIINTSGVHSRGGDFAANELAEIADKTSITGDAIRHYQKHAAGKRAIVFCVSIAHSRHVVDQFNAAGIPALHVDGGTDHDERDSAIRRFEAGEVRVLSNVDLFGEGFDVPALEAIICLRPTQSLALWLQMCGRPLRAFYGTGFDLQQQEGRLEAIRSGLKPFAVILDHAGNCQRHGLPDEERRWSLEGERRPKATAEGNASVKVCPKCFAAQFAGRAACAQCGHTFIVVSEKIEHDDGELAEVTADMMAQFREKNRDRVQKEVQKWKDKAERSACRDIPSLIEYAKKKGYASPERWAYKMMELREAWKTRTAR